MKNLIGSWLKIYENELELFLWTVALMFIVRGSGMILDNYAETAFLKRYGVEYMPIVNMINAIATFLVMGVLTGLMTRFTDARLLSYLFVFSGVSVAGLRALIPFGIDIIYPILFMLKSQYEVLHALLFWNLANNLFNTRQSKRLFPLITAGGVIGLIIGSFGTPFLSRTLSFDNLLIFYLVICLLGAVLVNRMSTQFPALLKVDKRPRKAKKKRTSMVEEFKNVLPLMKESVLVKLMIVLTLMPNVVIPVMNYQFNYAVNDQFATEGGLVQFFGYFRGVLNIISLFILLFVGRIYGRWGIPVALMFHPFNYLLAFLSFLMRFDVFSAIYARMSTQILRTTINIPAQAVIMGLFPESYRHMVRPFFRGTVVRIGLFIGSGLILLSVPYFHPRYLSLVCIPFVIGWIIAPFILKKRYAGILLDLITKNVIDLKSMEPKDIGLLFGEKEVRVQLNQAFLSAKGNDALWFAQLLKTLSIEDLDAELLKKVKDEDDETRIGLISLLSEKAGRLGIIRMFYDLIDPEKPRLAIAMVQAVKNLDLQGAPDFMRHVFETFNDLQVKANAAGILFRQNPESYRPVIDGWLGAEDIEHQKAGVVAATESGELNYADRFMNILNKTKNKELLPQIFEGLSRLGTPDLNQRIFPYLSYPEDSVRKAALNVFQIIDDDSLKQVITMMGDHSEEIYDLAKKKIEGSPYHNNLFLISSLAIPRRRVREGLFELLELFKIKDIDVIRFARSQVESGYNYLAEAEALLVFPESLKRELLIRHLNQERTVRLENTLRVLTLQDRTGQMKIISRGIFSSDSRQRANSLEALDDLIDPSLSKIMFPLLEDFSFSQQLVMGRKFFNLSDFGTDRSGIVKHLLAKPDWVTLVLTLYLIRDDSSYKADPDVMADLMKSVNPNVRHLAIAVYKGQSKNGVEKGETMEKEITISDKILHLKGIEIFEGLSVGELAAIASVTEEVFSPPAEIVIKEGDPGDTMYMVIDGEVSVIKGFDSKEPMELERIRGGDYFGEMALLDDIVRSATIRTEKESRFLVLHKEEFKEIVREYPQIALHICKVLSRRIRKLHEKVRI
ncbi:MAG: hypothetical protein A2V65_01010 [Deltaproteobacteria bacterium RBG_13_49_15]|nr:MAG: hypothetical protein A2V65_01010 [Deltaproteobacteria bacterium RBG_13_49_15]